MHEKPSRPLPSPRHSLLRHPRNKPDSGTSMYHPDQHAPCCHALVLLGATGVVVLGTALVDPSRLWLLVVPMVFCGAAYGAGAMVDRVVGGLVARDDHAPMVVLSARMGVGLACVSLVTFLSALSGMLWLAGLGALPAIAYGSVCAIRAGFQFRPLREPAAAGVGGCLLGGAWLVAWLWATIPPTFYDELVYHLVIPQRVLATGELLTLPWVFFTLMPHASDLLLTWGLVLGGAPGAYAWLGRLEQALRIVLGGRGTDRRARGWMATCGTQPGRRDRAAHGDTLVDTGLRPYGQPGLSHVLQSARRAALEWGKPGPFVGGSPIWNAGEPGVDGVASPSA